jgi:hypothetical protein
VCALLDGMELIAPGLVTVAEWRPDADEPVPEETIPLYGAVARKAVPRPRQSR